MKALHLLYFVCYLVAGQSKVPQQTNIIESGPPIGSESPAFSPQHVAGPDKGSHACPMCKYGYHPGVLVFLNSDNDWRNVTAICKRLEAESVKRRSQKFKAYLVYTNPTKLSVEDMEKKLKNFADNLSIKCMAVAYVPSIDDHESEMDLNRINPKTKTTIIVYNNRTVVEKFIDFIPTEVNFRSLFNTVDEAGKSKARLSSKN